MKKHFQRVTAVLLICILTLCEGPVNSSCLNGYMLTATATETQTSISGENTQSDKTETEIICETSADTVNAMFDAGLTGGEIAMVPATLTLDGEERDIWLVVILGLGGDQSKTNNYVSCVKAAFNIKSSYSERVKKFIYETVPAGSSIVFAGHSLGGMTAQQLRADKELTEDYNIIATFTAGSPFIITRKKLREGILSRISDSSDIVPFMSPAIIFSRKNHKDRAIEDGGYGDDHDGAHNKCYRRQEIWSEYDAIGRKDGDAVLKFINENMLRFSA